MIWAHRLHLHQKKVSWLLLKSVLKLLVQAVQLPDGYANFSKVLSCFTGTGAPGKLVEREKQPSEKNEVVVFLLCEFLISSHCKLRQELLLAVVG